VPVRCAVSRAYTVVYAASGGGGGAERVVGDGEETGVGVGEPVCAVAVLVRRVADGAGLAVLVCESLEFGSVCLDAALVQVGWRHLRWKWMACPTGDQAS